MKIRFREQFVECTNLGLTKERKFTSFANNPELKPAFPTKEMVEDINSGKWAGIDLIVCGKFGGICSGGHPECKKLRENGQNDCHKR